MLTPFNEGRFKGVVKWYSKKLKYGFVTITPRKKDITKGAQIFIHENDIQDITKQLFEDEMVEFDVISKISPYDGRISYKAVKVCKIRSGSGLFSGVCRGSEF